MKELCKCGKPSYLKAVIGASSMTRIIFSKSKNLVDGRGVHHGYILPEAIDDNHDALFRFTVISRASKPTYLR